MDSFKLKYLASCKEAAIPPTDTIMHVLRNSDKHAHNLLDFSGCNISVADCNFLAKCWASDTVVDDIRFTDCLLCEEACGIILRAISYNRNLTRIDLKGNNLRHSGSELVGKILKRSTTLRELNLEWNALGMWNQGVSAIADGLSMNQTLTYLNVSNNQISHEGGTDLAEALKRNSTLKHLDLRWNNVGVIGGRAFASALQHNKTLVKLQLGGNNIPADTLKAISSAVQRNVDCQSIYQEHQSMTQSLRNEINSLEHAKSIQVTTLLDQLDREKEMQEELSETTQHRLEQMRSVIEDRKRELENLRSRHNDLEREYSKEKGRNTELLQQVEKLEKKNEKDGEEHRSNMETLEKKLSLEKAEVERCLKEKADRVAELEITLRETLIKEESSAREAAMLKELMKKNEEDYTQTIQLAEKKLNQTRETMRVDHEEVLRGVSEKLKRSEHEITNLNEKVTRLKGDLSTEKLRSEEEMMQQRNKWKQEEISRTKQFDDRVDLLQSTRDEMQMKISKQSLQTTELQSQLLTSQKEVESLRRQIEVQKQTIENKESEHRNEINRARSETDNERRVVSESRDKISSLETKLVEAQAKIRDSEATASVEIAKLKDLVKARESDIERIHEEEARRAGLLESALHSYVIGSRSPSKR